MNICFLLQDTGFVYGAERATFDLADALREAGENVTVLLIEETRYDLGPGLRNELKDRGLTFELLPCRGRFSQELLTRLSTQVRSLKADVLHAVGYKADVHAALAFLRGARPALVATVHGWLERPDWKERFYGFLDRRALHLFDTVIALSRFYEQRLKQFGLSAEQLVRIPSGLPSGSLPSLEQTARRVETPFAVGMAGRLSWEKNHSMLLEALALLRQQGVRVSACIAGQGPELAVLQEHAHRLGVGDQIVWMGYIKPEQFYTAIQTMVLSSRIENLPYSILEAMAWARPVIATRVGGIPDLVTDGQTGFLVESGDAHGLAERIRTLAADPVLMRKMGLSARDRLEREFLMDRVVRDHVALYNRLIAQKRRSGPASLHSSK